MACCRIPDRFLKDAANCCMNFLGHRTFVVVGDIVGKSALLFRTRAALFARCITLVTSDLAFHLASQNLSLSLIA